MRFSEPREDFSRQHQDIVQRDGKPYGDLPEWADFAYSANVCRVVIATLAELASAPPPTACRNTPYWAWRESAKNAQTGPWCWTNSTLHHCST